MLGDGASQVVSGIFNNGITADETFENPLVVLRSHDVLSSLTDSLKQFSRLPNQSFAEFATILCALTCRTVRETHLQMTESEATEFAKDKLLTHLTTFTGLDVRKIFDSQRSTALRSNLDFYSFDGAVRTVTKIEHFIKPQDMQ